MLEEQSLGGYDTSGFSWPVDHQGVNFGGGWLRASPRPTCSSSVSSTSTRGGTTAHRSCRPDWVRDATAQQVATGGGFGGEGYGYQWWVTSARDEPAYAAVGYGGQLVEVVPSKRLVAAFVTEVLSTTPYGKSTHGRTRTSSATWSCPSSGPERSPISPARQRRRATLEPWAGRPGVRAARRP